MNNSKIVLDNLVEDTSRLGFLEREKGRLTQMVEALSRVDASEDWQKLKGLIWDSVIESIEKQIINEVTKDQIDNPELYRLQGQRLWARKYGDLKKLADGYRQQIETIKNQIKHEQKNPRDGAL